MKRPSGADRYFIIRLLSGERNWQKRFDYVLGDGNKRQAKANDNYYLLLHVKEPIVIAECGFLSNREEAKKLETEEYQDRLGWTLHMGIMEYLNQNQ